MDLDTSRLRVRELTPADLNAVHAVHHPGVAMNDNIRAELGRWLEWTVRGYEQYRRLYQPPYGEYGIVLKGTGELVGLVGLVPSLMPFALVPSYAVGPGQPSGSAGHPYSLAEVGLFWAVADVHRRNGYAAEAGAALVDFMFAEWHLQRVVATTEHTNTASVGVMRKLGMRIDRNPGAAPFFLQVLGVLDNPRGEPEWPASA
jgi:RimJ/RimL family protein N-acetyltransferase